MTDNDLAGDLRQALEGVTPGPWVWRPWHDLDSTVRPYPSVIAIDHDGGCGCRRDCDLTVEMSDADRALIAAAPDLLARAAHRIEELEQIVHSIGNEFRFFMGTCPSCEAEIAHTNGKHSVGHAACCGIAAAINIATVIA